MNLKSFLVSAATILKNFKKQKVLRCVKSHPEEGGEIAKRNNETMSGWFANELTHSWSTFYFTKLSIEFEKHFVKLPL